MALQIVQIRTPLAQAVASAVARAEAALGDPVHTPHLAVEVDEEYEGGDYNEVGEQVLIPEVLYREFLAVLGDEERAIGMALRHLTGIDPVHIVGWSPDDAGYRADGSWVDAEEEALARR